MYTVYDADWGESLVQEIKHQAVKDVPFNPHLKLTLKCSGWRKGGKTSHDRCTIKGVVVCPEMAAELVRQQYG